LSVRLTELQSNSRYRKLGSRDLSPLSNGARGRVARTKRFTFNKPADLSQQLAGGANLVRNRAMPDKRTAIPLLTARRVT